MAVANYGDAKLFAIVLPKKLNALSSPQEHIIWQQMVWQKEGLE
jgi:hypothetical protein